MKAVDLFAGAGGFSEGASAAGAKILWAGNHNRIAVEYHAINHPYTAHFCQDLHQANWANVPRHDLLLASPCCVPGDAKILKGGGGYVEAKDLKVGDYVYTHKGNVKRVSDSWVKNFCGNMVSLSMSGENKESISLTYDHRVYIRRKGGHYSRLGDPFWVRADQIRKGDYVSFPKIKEREGAGASFVSSKIPERVRYKGRYESSLPGAKVKVFSSPDLWWLIGHFLGDGLARKDRPVIGWSIGGSQDNKRKIKAILKRFGLSSWDSGEPTNMTIRTSSKHLYAICVSFGRLCHEKFIPDELHDLENDLAEALISGYLDADGCVKKGFKNKFKATSTSLDLLRGIQLLCWRLGWSASISNNNYKRKSILEGRQVNCRDTWEILITKKPHAQSRTKFTDHHVWRSVKKVEFKAVKNEVVYDFEVEDDHSFVLPGVIVHNCQGHSKARGKKRNNPQHDASRSTAWAVVSCAEFHRPKYVIIENVQEFLQWELYPAFELALKTLGYSMTPYIIDSADHGVPQNRIRMFIVCGYNHTPKITLPKRQHTPASTFIDFNSGRWSNVLDKAEKTVKRYINGRADHGERFLMSYYGSTKGGRELDRPIGTITTKDRWAVVKEGGLMRMLSPKECQAAMGFRPSYILPKEKTKAVHLLGNAVCPPVATDLVKELMKC